MLRSTDLERLKVALTPAIKVESTKAVSSIRSSVTNLPGNMTHEQFCDVLISYYRTLFAEVKEATSLPTGLSDHLRSREWIYGRSPDFWHQGRLIQDGNL